MVPKFEVVGFDGAHVHMAGRAAARWDAWRVHREEQTDFYLEVLGHVSRLASEQLSCTQHTVRWARSSSMSQRSCRPTERNCSSCRGRMTRSTRLPVFLRICIERFRGILVSNGFRMTNSTSRISGCSKHIKKRGIPEADSREGGQRGAVAWAGAEADSRQPPASAGALLSLCREARREANDGSIRTSPPVLAAKTAQGVPSSLPRELCFWNYLKWTKRHVDFHKLSRNNPARRGSYSCLVRCRAEEGEGVRPPPLSTGSRIVGGRAASARARADGRARAKRRRSRVFCQEEEVSPSEMVLVLSHANNEHFATFPLTRRSCR